MTDTARFVLGIIGISGGILCAIADLLLDIKGPDNRYAKLLCCESWIGFLWSTCAFWLVKL
ncbi:hypothetical protein [Butyrivibrio sp. JL13D10]|uniref:hypothetical protein n=1 Tax=Butyrivibrio sp. JL13D10 TaxID=3236815 RepID=UPI0038B52D3C